MFPHSKNAYILSSSNFPRRENKLSTMVLSSTDDDDDDASWSNLPSLSVVDDDDDDESEDAFSCGGQSDDVDETLMGTDGQHVPCDDDKRELMSFSGDDDVQKIKEAHEQNLEDIEDAWEDKEEDVKKWLELAEEQQFDAKKRMMMSTTPQGSRRKRRQDDTPIFVTEERGQNVCRVQENYAGGETRRRQRPRREKRSRNAMEKLTRSLDVKLVMSSVVSVCIGIVALYAAVSTRGFGIDTTARAPRSSETTNFEERLKAMEEIQRCEVKLERAKEKVEELVTKILEEKRKLRLQRQRRGLFTLWTEFSAGEYSEAVSSWTAMVAVVTYFTAISMISLWFWKLVNFAYFGALGEMEESSFFKTATTTATKSERSGKSVSAKKDDEGEQENPIDSYAKVARHLNHNDTTVNKSSVSPSSSLRAVRTPNDLGVPKPFATSSQRRQSVSPTVSYKRQQHQEQQEEANDLPPLFKYPRYKKTPHEPIISHRRSREDSVNNFGRRMQDVADEDLAMNIYGEQ